MERESPNTINKAKYCSCYEAESIDCRGEGLLLQPWHLTLGFPCTPAGVRLSDMDRMACFT